MKSEAVNVYFISSVVALVFWSRVAHSYPVAILAGRGINYNGWSVIVDSFDSSDPANSTGGRYDPAKAGDAGDVVANDGLTNNLPIGGALIYGHLYTRSNSPVVLGTNGGVGTHSWLATNLGIEPGYRLSTFNIALSDTGAPYSTGAMPGSGDVVMPSGITNHYDHILYQGDYYATNLGGLTLVLGAARLVMPNGLQLLGTDGITLGSGGSLLLYLGGTNCVITGGVIANEAGLARSFIVYGSPSLTNLALNLNSSFNAVIIAPNAATEINCSGSGTVDVSGSLTVESIQLNGNVRFHFDRSLTGAATLQPSLASPAGSFEFEVMGFPGFSYRLESSFDLNSWTSVTTNISPFTFTDAETGRFNRRFYRALYRP